jgi:hypothetical protein
MFALPCHIFFSTFMPTGASEEYDNPLVIAGLDPAIHHFSKKMDTRVKPAYDNRIC